MRFWLVTFGVWVLVVGLCCARSLSLNRQLHEARLANEPLRQEVKALEENPEFLRVEEMRTFVHKDVEWVQVIKPVFEMLRQRQQAALRQARQSRAAQFEYSRG